jgi:hypothetical protein
MPAGPNLISFPTLQAECHDTEARSLKKINELQLQLASTLAALASPGGAGVAPTAYLYGNQYRIPAGADLLDLGCYNPNDGDVWVYVVISPGGPQPGIPPTFPIRVYGHNHAYYEAMTSHLSVPAGQRFDIAVSSTELTLTWSSSVYLAIRHS